MERETRIKLAVFAGLMLVAVLIAIGGRVQRELGPEPRAAWVAISTPDRPLAVSGPVELAAGEPYTLHAVLEAESWGGERVFYTEAERLRLGDEEVPASSLRRWGGAEEVRILWFTVEGGPPYLEVASAADLEALQFRELFRADWPQTWSVPGSVEPSRRRLEAGPFRPSVGEFGRQRYHVRIEFPGPAGSVVPRLRISSWRAEEVEERSERFATATVRLDGRLAGPSGLFGMPQVEVAEGADPALVSRVGELWRRGLAFSRLELLRGVLESAGRSWETAGWMSVELDAGPAWGAGGASPGDLLRVGRRFVILVADEGESGILDYGDLAFDFDNGAVLRRLDEIFTGEGLVEWAPLGRAAAG